MKKSACGGAGSKGLLKLGCARLLLTTPPARISIRDRMLETDRRLNSSSCAKSLQVLNKSCETENFADGIGLWRRAHRPLRALVTCILRGRCVRKAMENQEAYWH
jgi:hypothetical protein